MDKQHSDATEVQPFAANFPTRFSINDLLSEQMCRSAIANPFDFLPGQCNDIPVSQQRSKNCEQRNIHSKKLAQHKLARSLKSQPPASKADDGSNVSQLQDNPTSVSNNVSSAEDAQLLQQFGQSGFQITNSLCQKQVLQHLLWVPFMGASGSTVFCLSIYSSFRYLDAWYLFIYFILKK